uniref:Uncharacterized protein n=1 Tax=Meloidogyne enterolobii TaxID=390850 RepID=A0A6V7V2S6_MELEN|nr:unnamed protein product [Meloidogyne enterolobii]
MLKRKADTELECPVLVKNLRRSISEFLVENEAANVKNDDGNIEFLDYGGERWEKYRQRLATFDLKSRILLSKEVSPVECARHGWKNIRDDFLQCDDCEKILCVKMPVGEDITNRVFNRCIWYIQRRLVEAHTVICPWRTNGGLSISNPYDVIERYKVLAESNLPEVDFVKAFDDEESLKKFGNVNQFFLQMAIFGWLPAEKNNEGIQFSCHLCGRDLKCCVFSQKLPLNPMEEHHSYCPILDKIYPLWSESLRNVHKLKKNESLIPKLWNVKSMLKRIFGIKGKEQQKQIQDGDEEEEIPPPTKLNVAEIVDEVERRKSI